MSNRYYDTFIYAIDKENNLDWIQIIYDTAYGCGYGNDYICPHKTYSIMSSCDGEGDMTAEEIGERIPAPSLDEWQGFFSNGASKDVVDIFQYTNMQLEDVSSIIWISTNSVSAGTYDSSGYIITSEGCYEMDRIIFEKCDAELGDGFHIPELPINMAITVWNMLSSSRKKGKNRLLKNE